MEPKPHQTYEQQLAILKRRGLRIDDADEALALLGRVGYYTLSGYSYPFRLRRLDGSRADEFRRGTHISQVRALWEFDNRLRIAAFASIQHAETHLRALLAYELGAIDPLIHRRPELLSIDRGVDHTAWLAKLDRQVADSREDFIVHHRNHRSSVIPIWVAVDVLDWGGLSYLFSFTPPPVRETVAAIFDLSGPQLKSWLRALNVVRNVCAHHARLFNRYYSLTPKLTPRGQQTSLDAVSPNRDTTFAMLTLLQHLGGRTLGYNPRLLPATLTTFPEDSGLDLGSVGTPKGWQALPLWAPGQRPT